MMGGSFLGSGVGGVCEGRGLELDGGCWLVWWKWS